MSNLSALGRSALQIGGAIIATAGASSGYLDPTIAANIGSATANGHVGTATAIQLGGGALASIIGAIWSQRAASKRARVEAAATAAGVDVAAAKKGAPL